MKKYCIFALVFVMAAALLAGCRGPMNNDNANTNNTSTPTGATSAPTVTQPEPETQTPSTTESTSAPTESMPGGGENGNGQTDGSTEETGIEGRFRRHMPGIG